MIQRIARLTPSVKDGIRYSEEKKRKKNRGNSFWIEFIETIFAKQKNQIVPNYISL